MTMSSIGSWLGLLLTTFIAASWWETKSSKEDKHAEMAVQMGVIL